MLSAELEQSAMHAEEQLGCSLVLVKPTASSHSVSPPRLLSLHHGSMWALHEFCGWAPYSTRKHGGPAAAEREKVQTKRGRGGKRAPGEGASAGWRAGLIPRALGCSWHVFECGVRKTGRKEQV